MLTHALRDGIGWCDVGGALFAGSMVARISGGDDTFALELDPRALTIGGNGVGAIGGIGSGAGVPDLVEIALQEP